MTIILTAAQKGGVGKSTTAVNIAAVLAKQGQTPLLFDSDPQPTATNWWAARGLYHPDYPAILSRQEYGDIGYILNDLTDQYQTIIVDAAGHDSVEMRSAMTVCDILLIPFQPSQPDLETIPHMCDVVNKAKSVNPKLKAYAFLSIAPTNVMRTVIDQSRQVITDAIANYPVISLLSTVIYNRAVYAACMSEGLGVVEMDGKSPSIEKAKEEVRQLVQEVMSHD
jgi:chromosome partitioning protein